MEARKVWAEAIGLSALAAFLYQSALLVFVFLVPLEVLSRRRGADWLGMASVLTGLVILVSRIVGLVRLGVDWDASILLMEMFAPVTFLGGLYLLETRLIVGVRRLYRLVQAIMVVGAVSVPIIMLISSSDIAMQALRGQFEVLHDMFAGDAAGSPELGRFATVDGLMDAVITLLLSTYLFAYALVLSANWYLGRLIAAKMLGVEPYRLRRFYLPEPFIWAMVAASAGALLSVVAELGVFEHVAWNALFIVLLLYAAQGLGIMWSLLDRYEIAQAIRIGIAAGLVILLAIPGVNMLVFLGLPGLGLGWRR